MDSLILSQLSYINFDGVVPGLTEGLKAVRIADCLKAERFASMLTETRDPKSNKRLLQAAAASPRFRDIGMSSFVSEFDPVTEKQFSAVTYILPESTKYIAFRGTDDTLIGWKEDFNMAFVYPVPSQKRALEYLLEISRRMSGNLIIGGHSKGGNLAVYSALSAPPLIRGRILRIYDHDGPGFKEGVLESEGYRAVEDRIEKIVPQSSLIGMLLEGHKKYTVVESSRFGVMQHDPFSWKISDGAFITAEEVSDGARYVNGAIREWVGQLSPEDREKFTDLLFGVLDAGDAKTFSEITLEWRKNFSAIFAAIRESDPEMKRFIAELIKDFGLLLFHNLRLKRRPAAELPPAR
ncbi:MAG: DUF2974 domain-containing protein [Oscillospiraceae bacterium]|nr:DUF2974 domain-containing protein [Oscillospiraceae bacterium]